MKQITAEWVAKAEADFGTLEREARVRKDPNFDGICFHSQQRAEKYLKARLSEANFEFAKIHDLVALLELVLSIEPTWEAFREDLAFLSDYAVNVRYPGEAADRDSAINARNRGARNHLIPAPQIVHVARQCYGSEIYGANSLPTTIWTPLAPDRLGKSGGEGQVRSLDPSVGIRKGWNNSAGDRKQP